MADPNPDLVYNPGSKTLETMLAIEKKKKKDIIGLSFKGYEFLLGVRSGFFSIEGASGSELLFTSLLEKNESNIYM